MRPLPQTNMGQMNNHEPSATHLDQWLRSDARRFLPQAVLADGVAMGPYHVLGLLGRGGNAEVYRAISDDGTIVALKVPLHRDDATSVERFRREIRLLRELHHQALPRLVDSGESDGLPWMAMEELFPCESPRSPRAVARHLVALCEGLDRLHARGLVHRDIKPANILCRADGSPVLIDFGLVKEAAKAAPFPTTNSPLSVADGHAVGHGTPGWAAPEQFSGDDISPAADVYALGMLALDCFHGEPPRSWRPLLLRATSPVPSHRHPDAAAFARAIRRRNVPVAAWLFGLLVVGIAMGTMSFRAAHERRGQDNAASTYPHVLNYVSNLAEHMGFAPAGWLTSSDDPWEVDPDIPGAIRSHYKGGNSSSVLSIPVEGPARVTVRYRRHFVGNALLGDDPRPRSSFTILDGENSLFLDEEGDADASKPLGEERTEVLDISEGFHRLKFIYHHSGIGYIDQFSGVRTLSLTIDAVTTP